MAASGSNSAQQRREAQREILRQQRQAELRRQRTIRRTVIALITVVALVLVGGLAYLLIRANEPAGPVVTPETIAEDQPYLAFGAPEDSGAPVVEIHVDFMCPHCGTFEQINGDDLQQMAENEEAAIHIVPRRFMDGSSSTGDFSTRAANAFVSVYADDPANALAFQQLVFANQPGAEGLTDEQLWSFAQEVGASDNVKNDIENLTYQQWVRDVADPYASENGGSTPWVEISDEIFEDWGTPGALREAVLAAGGPAASDGGGDAADASDGGEG